MTGSCWNFSSAQGRPRADMTDKKIQGVPRITCKHQKQTGLSMRWGLGWDEMESHFEWRKGAWRGSSERIEWMAYGTTGRGQGQDASGFKLPTPQHSSHRETRERGGAGQRRALSQQGSQRPTSSAVGISSAPPILDGYLPPPPPAGSHISSSSDPLRLLSTRQSGRAQ